MKNMTARAAARAAGATTYETGIPCKQGHLAPRATRTGSCTECTRLAAQRWMAQRPGKAAEYTAAYRERNRAAVRERDRVSKAQKWRDAPEQMRMLSAARYREKVEAGGREVRPRNVLPITELVQRLHTQHDGRILYVAGYTSMTEHAVFTCSVHGRTLPAFPHNVLRGANPCPQCNHMKSQGEDAVFRLVSRAATALQRDRSLLRPKELDIYLPEKRLAIEYCGDYWHSHGDPDSERRDRGKHYEKYLACRAKGVRLLTIYESEWLTRQRPLRRLIRTALGQARGRVMARKCTLGTPTDAQAREFYERYHPQGGAGSGKHYGLYWRGKLVACMRFSFGANDRGAAAVNRVWTLTRYATRVTVAGGASRLFKAFVQEHNPAAVKSFSDNRYFAGGMYEQLGFRLEGETAPDYQVWSPVLGLLPKARYQRRVIPDRLRDHGRDDAFDPDTDPRTEAEMTYLMGCRRLYDCGKRRWIWTP